MSKILWGFEDEGGLIAVAGRGQEGIYALMGVDGNFVGSVMLGGLFAVAGRTGREFVSFVGIRWESYGFWDDCGSFAVAGETRREQRSVGGRWEI